jgi:alkylation response protein AidB-like acyl-CoA dehydrogenase
MTASYLGIASALVERVLAKSGAPDLELTNIVGQVETAMAAVETVAYRLGNGYRDDAALAESLFVRYAAQDTIARVAPRAVELLGGMNFIGSSDVGYLAASCNGLALHPPARTKMAGRPRS